MKCKNIVKFYCSEINHFSMLKEKKRKFRVFTILWNRILNNSCKNNLNYQSYFLSKHFEISKLFPFTHISVATYNVAHIEKEEKKKKTKTKLFLSFKKNETISVYFFFFIAYNNFIGIEILPPNLKILPPNLEHIL